MFANLSFVRRGIATTAAAALLAIVASGARAGNDARTIEVALDLPFSGTAAGTISSMANAYSLAVDEANAAGFPGGYRVRIMRFDHGRPGVPFDVKLAAQNARDNLADSKIVAVFGTFNSAAAKAEVPIFDAAGLAEISSTNTNPGLTKGAAAAKLREARPDDNPYFRVCGTDDLQGSAGAQLLDQLGAKNVYIVDDNDTYGKSLADLFEISFRANGGKILAHEQTSISQRDYTALVGRIKAARPDAVYFGATGIELGTLRKDLADTGLRDLPLLGGDAMSESAYPKAAGSAAVKSYFTVMTPDGLYLANPIARRFNESFERHFHAKPLPYDAGTYAAGEVEMAAIREVLAHNGGKFPSRDDVRRAIARTAHLETAIGPVTFNVAGDIRNPYVSYFTYEGPTKVTFVKQFAFHT